MELYFQSKRRQPLYPSGRAGFAQTFRPVDKMPGLALAWITNSMRMRFQGSNRTLRSEMAFSTPVRGPRPGIRARPYLYARGGFAFLRCELRKASLDCRDAWAMVACFACNGRAGSPVHFAEGRWCQTECTPPGAVGLSVDRLLNHGWDTIADPSGCKKES